MSETENKTNARVEHKANVLVQLEIFSKDEAAIVVTDETLKEYGLTNSFTLSIEGETLGDCLRKVKAKLSNEKAN